MASLIIEDGSGKAGSDSYATAADLVTYAGNYGVTVPATEAEQEVLLRRAAVAMNALAWQGDRAVSGQALAWPRYGALVHGEYIAHTAIPREIQYGQMALAVEIADYDANPPEEVKGAVVREKVDVLEVEYANVSNIGKVMPVGASAPSRALFADYLGGRGWSVPVARA